MPHRRQDLPQIFTLRQDRITTQRALSELAVLREAQAYVAIFEREDQFFQRQTPFTTHST